MKTKTSKVAAEMRVPSSEEIARTIREKAELLIQYCREGEDEARTLLHVEQRVCDLVFGLGRLFIQLFLVAVQERLRYEVWLESDRYYFNKQMHTRTIKTVFGPVQYGRGYLAKKKGSGGFFPLDGLVGLTGDGFSPWVISLCCKLATRVSFEVSTLLFKSFCGWSPSSEAIQGFVLGLGREAGPYMETADPPQDEGEVLVIEADGKATPTATESELKKRRGKRRKRSGCPCGCQRHRGRQKRRQCKRKRRKKGDKSKNGRSITLAVMYTLKEGEDGKLHGPKNKKVWGSYAPRRAMFDWVRQQATRRGFGPGSGRRVHILMDGEKCLYGGLSKRFSGASFALDIRHVEEKIWDAGRTFERKGGEELKVWVEGKIKLLYQGKVRKLVKALKALKGTLSSRSRRDAGKRASLADLIGYIEPRRNMMSYNKLVKDDLPIATGMVEGAARYVIGERMDCSGMRWIPERAELLLHLRCIELNGEWDSFFQWAYNRWVEELRQGDKVLVRATQGIDLSCKEAPKYPTSSTAA